jgi:tetratricopeptide (TPR) repeat protein
VLFFPVLVEMKKLVIGICTVSTRKINYLPTTLRSLLKNISERNKSDILIRIYNCDFKGREINPIEGFEKEIEEGLVEVVRVDNHPEFKNLPINFGDSPNRVKWRTKQCYDFSEAFRLSYGLGDYYMHVEDDVIACKDFDTYVLSEIKNNQHWCTIHMAKGGFIGWVFHNNDLPRLSALFREFRDEMPPDWLINFFVRMKISTGRHYVTPNYSIFQHIGIERSLQNTTQQVVFDNYIGGYQDLDLLAFQHYQTGDLQQAKHICTEILREQPTNEAILYLLGVVYAQLEEYDLAVQHLKRALQGNTNNADAYLALGAVFQKKGLLDEATTYYQRAIEIEPDFAEAYENLGDIFRGKQQLDEAITYYKKAIQYCPTSAETHCTLANIFKEKGLPDIATIYYRNALKNNPDYAEAYNNFGTILKDQHRLDEAITHYQKAVQINPNYGEAYVNLGIVFSEKGQFDEAIDCYQKAIEINPKTVLVYIKLSDAFWRKGQINEALIYGQKAIDLDGDNAFAHYNMAFFLFSVGDLRRGWQEFEWHWKTKAGIDCLQRYAQPLWTGTGFDTSGRTVLLHDQPRGSAGFGDTIQFIRYAPLIAKLGANVIFECKKELISLLRNVEGIHQVIALGGNLPAFDVHCFLLDLPFIFETSLYNIPSRIPYIPGNPNLILKWREKMHNQDKFKIGLTWGEGHGAKCCSLETYSSIGLNDKVIFYSLQKGESAQQAKNPPRNMHFINLTGDIQDFSDTAALMENLDLIISVDTSVAHLAGALGKPVWTLLPFISCWRWMSNREDSPWYPTMRLFRQPSPGDWESVIAKVKDELLKLLSKH